MSPYLSAAAVAISSSVSLYLSAGNGTCQDTRLSWGEEWRSGPFNARCLESPWRAMASLSDGTPPSDPPASCNFNRLACSFHQHDPRRYRTSSSCNGAGFPDFVHLMSVFSARALIYRSNQALSEHLKKVHFNQCSKFSSTASRSCHGFGAAVYSARNGRISTELSSLERATAK